MIPLLDPNSKEPIFAQIYRFFKEAILQNKIQKGTYLPSIRKLARDLGVSNNTIISAYQQLADEGYVQNKDRKGVVVKELDSGIWLMKDAREEKIIGKKEESPEILFDLGSARIDEKAFPMKEWRKVIQMSLDKNQYQYADYFGESSLKNALCKYLYASRGVISTSEQVIIGAGTNFLISFLPLILQRKNLKVIFEDPGYDEIRKTLSNAGCFIMPIEVNEHGIDVGRLQDLEGDLLYLTPSHQYPTGVLMPVQNRIKALQWAEKTDCYIIEDDYDSEFRYKGQPIPALQALDNQERVIYLGTFSKAFMPSLRMAYMVLPKKLLPLLDGLRYMGQTVPYFTQRAMAILLEDGLWEKHLRKMRTIYGRKYYESIEQLKIVFGEKITFRQNDSGLNIMIEIDTESSEEELIKKAFEKGILIKGTSQCRYIENHTNHRPALLFGFGNLEESRILEAMNLLKYVWSI